MLFNTLGCFVFSSISTWYFKARPCKYIVKTMVLEGFSNFRVSENYFPNSTILPPKLAPKSPKILEKTFLKTCCFLMSIFHWFWVNFGDQSHPKMSPWAPPSLPRTLLERLLDAPGAKKASQTQFLVVLVPFWVDFKRIWTPKWFPKCFKNIQNLFVGFSYFLLVLQDLSLPASGLQVASAGCAKR